MAHRYSASIAAAQPSVGCAYAEMLAGASKSVSVRAIRVTTLSALGGEVALERAYSVGTGAATGIATGVSHRLASSPTTSARLQAAWTSSGITPTGYGSSLRGTVLGAATGTTYDLWRADDGPLVLEPSESLVLLRRGSGSGLATGAALRVDITWEEGPSSDH